MVGSGASPTAITGAVVGLMCNTVYHFRAVATNAGGTTNGADAVFTTGACNANLPTVATGVATGIGATVATLNGTVNPNGTATTAYFRFGPTTSYGSTTPAVNAGSGTLGTIISNGGLSGLSCGTMHH